MAMLLHHRARPRLLLLLLCNARASRLSALPSPPSLFSLIVTAPLTTVAHAEGRTTSPPRHHLPSCYGCSSSSSPSAAVALAFNPRKCPVSRGFAPLPLPPKLGAPSACRHYASRSGGRGPPSPKAGDDEDDDDDDLDEDEDDEFDDVEDPSGYEWDYDTWNLLHQGKKENEKSRRWPLPMYKAREMVDYHMIKNRVDGLKVITDPKQEYELRKTLHEGLVEFYRKTQAAFDEIDAAVEKEQNNIEGGDGKEALQIEAGETSGATEGQKEPVEGIITEGKEVKISLEAVDSSGGEEASVQVELLESESQSHPEGEEPLKLEQELSAEESKGDSEELTTTSVIDDILNDVLTVPDITVEGENALETKLKEDAVGDEVNALNYDKWVAYQDQEMAKKYEIKKHHATLRWKIQLVLGPGDAWHPANRKASVSVYVRELGLSKHAKKRLLALVGKRYKSPQDELTIVSERYQHRYENQKDVLRTLLALIEEAKKADEYVNDARIDFIRSQNKASKGVTTVADSQISI